MKKRRGKVKNSDILRRDFISPKFIAGADYNLIGMKDNRGDQPLHVRYKINSGERGVAKIHLTTNQISAWEKINSDEADDEK